MTPEALAEALTAANLDGVTVQSSTARSVVVACGSARVRCHVIGGEWYAYAQGKPPRSFFPTMETLRPVLVEALAWSLTAEPLAPAAPETRAALRDGGMWGDVVRKHLRARLEMLTAYNLNRGLRIEIAAALEVTL